MLTSKDCVHDGTNSTWILYKHYDSTNSTVHRSLQQITSSSTNSTLLYEKWHSRVLIPPVWLYDKYSNLRIIVCNGTYSTQTYEGVRSTASDDRNRPTMAVRRPPEAPGKFTHKTNTTDDAAGYAGAMAVMVGWLGRVGGLEWTASWSGVMQCDRLDILCQFLSRGWRDLDSNKKRRAPIVLQAKLDRKTDQGSVG